MRGRRARQGFPKERPPASLIFGSFLQILSPANLAVFVSFYILQHIDSEYDVWLRFVSSIVFGDFLYFRKHNGFVSAFLMFRVPSVPLSGNLPQALAAEEIPFARPATPPCALSGFIFHPGGG
jgi:hypothetical protein